MKISSTCYFCLGYSAARCVDMDCRCCERFVVHVLQHACRRGHAQPQLVKRKSSAKPVAVCCLKLWLFRFSCVMPLLRLRKIFPCWRFPFEFLLSKPDAWGSPCRCRDAQRHTRGDILGIHCVDVILTGCQSSDQIQVEWLALCHHFRLLLIEVDGLSKGTPRQQADRRPRDGFPPPLT